MKHSTLLTLVLGLISSIVLGQSESLPDYRKTDLSNLQEYIDSTVIKKMEEYHVPGSIIIVVQEGEEVYYKGYGLADIGNNIEVDKDLTGFRVASVTKTFTATAVMQLVEQGKLELHASINEYLPDENFSFLGDHSITLHQLLTHTAGFDLTDIGDAAKIPEKVIPLEEIVRYHMPKIVHPPGSVYSYSNFGYTLVGYIIQQVSNMPYEEYIMKHILLPLGMTHSNMSQPLPNPIKNRLSKSYKWDGQFINLPRDYTNTVPGGGLITTAKDMTNYMLAQLNNGSLDSIQLLSPEHHKTLTTQHFGSKGTEYGICYAFIENGWTGRRCLEHTGGQLGFLSIMTLIPETGTGIFIAHNTRQDAGGFRYDIARAVLDTMLHRKERNTLLPNPSDQAEFNASNFTGNYRQMDYPHSTFEKLGVLLGFANAQYNVDYTDNGMLHMRGQDYVHLGNNVFHENDEKGAWSVNFDLNEKGKAVRLNAGVTSYKRTAWYEDTRLRQMILGTAFLLLLINLLRRPISYIKRMIRKKSMPSKGGSVISNWLYLSCFFCVLGLIGILTNLAIYEGDLADYGVPLTFKFSLLLTTIGGLSAIFAPYAFFKIVIDNAETLKHKIWISLLLCSLTFIALGYWHYNVIGFWY